MTKFKSHIMDWQDKIWSIPHYEDIITSAEHIDEVKSYVCKNLNLKYQADITFACEVVEDDWTELWSKYYGH